MNLERTILPLLFLLAAGPAAAASNCQISRSR